MNTPYSVKKKVFKKGKESTETEYVRNADKKKDFISKFGKEKFEQVALKDPEVWGKLKEPPFPKEYSWIWFQFLDIWRTCGRDFAGNVILTPRQLMDYCECFKVTLTVFERHLIFRMKTWAEETIYSLKEKEAKNG